MKIINYARVLAILPLITLADCHKIFKPKPERPGPYAFDVTLKMSPKSEVAMKDAVGISTEAYYFGQKAGAPLDYTVRQNRVELGDERWDLQPGVRRLHFEGTAIRKSDLAQTSDSEARVLVTVDIVSKDPEYVLTCKNYVGAIRQAQQRPPVIKCEFDAERYWEDHAESSAE